MDSMPKRPLRGILKKPTAHAEEGVPTIHSRRERTEKDNLEIARKHAAILQQRKDYENEIFLAIEKLTDFPLVRDEAHFSAAHPAATDVATFLHLVRIFQPGDYDDLIEERNTCGLCGYALCARPHKQFAGHGTWKLVNAGRHDFGIVHKEELEKWCSPACARRALYIKVQLNETAAWERVGIPDIQVELLEEKGDREKGQGQGQGQGQDDKAPETQQAKTAAPAKTAEDHLAQDLARLKLEQERKLAQNQKALAVERGDASSVDAADQDDGKQLHPIQPKAALVDVNVFEKTVTATPQAPSLGDGGTASDSHLLLEGHKTKFVGM